MRVLTLVYTAVFVLMLVFAIMSFMGVFTDPYIDPGM